MLKGKSLKYLDAWTENVTKVVQDNVKSKDLFVSGKLHDSIKCSYTQVENTLTIAYSMENYGYFQDEGVQGANPSKIKGGVQRGAGSRFKFGSGSGNGSLFKGLDKWTIMRGIAPRTAKGKFTSRASIKFAMAKSIYFQGLPPRKFFKDVWSEEIEKLKTKLPESINLDIQEQIQVKLKKRYAN